MKLSGEQLESLYTTMVRIRRFDEKTAELFQAGLVKGTAHSYVGEEAVAAGACASLREGDYIVGTHRGHGHCIAKGARLDLMMAELMGRQDGYCRGLGGSMHIPALVEAVTYRWRGHSMRANLPDYRTKEEEREWMERDPIARLGHHLVESRHVTPIRLKELEERVEVELDRAVEFAKASPEPSVELM